MIKYLMLLSLVLAITLAENQYDEEMVFDARLIAACNDLQLSRLTCTNCSTLARCVRMGNSWQSVRVATCDESEGFYCNPFEGDCSRSIGPCNQAIEFQCTGEGYFPNPYNCQTYFLCATVDGVYQAIRSECELGAAFDVNTQQCGLSVSNEICTSLQFNCTSAGRIGAWPRSTNLFYVCIQDEFDRISPTLYRCPGSQIFDVNGCIDPPPPTTTPVP